MSVSAMNSKESDVSKEQGKVSGGGRFSFGPLASVEFSEVKLNREDTPRVWGHHSMKKLKVLET